MVVLKNWKADCSKHFGVMEYIQQIYSSISSNAGNANAIAEKKMETMITKYLLRLYARHRLKIWSYL